MTQVNATEIQEHLSDFLDSLAQGETSIVIEQAGKAIATLISYEEWKRLKQLESYLVAEDDEESFTPELVNEMMMKLGLTHFNET